MNIVFKVVCLLMVFLVCSPTALATFVYEDEYAMSNILVDVENLSNNTGTISTVDMYDVNNFNSTIRPFMDDNTDIRGIAQANLGLPHVYAVNTTNTPANETILLSWMHIPDGEKLHDSSVLSWIRLPINNMSIGDIGTAPSTGDYTKIRLAVYQLHSENYNVSLGTTLEDSDLVAGAHGETPYTLLGKQTILWNYALHGFPDVTLPYPVFSYVRRDTERNVSWTTSNSTATTSHTVEYNFTWIRCLTPLARNQRFVFIVELNRFDNGSAHDTEIIFSDGDNNMDKLYWSHISIGGEQIDAPIDFDVPFIYQDLMSGPVGGIGINSIHAYENLRSYVPIDATWSENQHFSLSIPVYGYKETLLLMRMAYVTSAGVVRYGTGFRDIYIHPGYNMVHINGSFASPWADVVAMGFEAVMFNIFINSVELNCSFWTTKYTNPGTIFDGGAYVNFSLLSLSEDSSGWYPHHTANTPVFMGLYIGASEVSYVPIGQYTVYVVPDPYDYQAGIEYVQYAQFAKHAIYDTSLWMKNEAEEDAARTRLEAGVEWYSERSPYTQYAICLGVSALVVAGGWKLFGGSLGAGAVAATTNVGPAFLPSAFLGGVGGGATVAGAGLLAKIGALTLAGVASTLVWDWLNNQAFGSTLFKGLVYVFNYVSEWIQNYFPNVFAAMSWVWSGLKTVGSFVYEVVEFLYHNLSNMITNALHFMALWAVMSVYLLTVWAANGICTAVTRGRRMRRGGDILSTKTFDRVIVETWDRYWKLLTMNMSIISALMGTLIVVLRMVSPI